MTYTGDGVIHCDKCPEHIETGQDGFKDSLAEAKEKGWRSFQEKDDWVHVCPACVYDFAEEQRKKRGYEDTGK